LWVGITVSRTALEDDSVAYVVSLEKIEKTNLFGEEKIEGWLSKSELDKKVATSSLTLASKASVFISPRCGSQPAWTKKSTSELF
jgi:hypothetical protein